MPALLIIICVSLIIVAVFFLKRNDWVYIQSIILVNKLADQRKLSDEELDKYLSYNQMLFRFWIWDIEKLKRK